MTFRFGSFLLIIAITAACTSTQSDNSPPLDGVSLSHSPESPSPGDSVTLVLRNGSDGTVGYNLCTSSLFRQSGSDWVPVPEDRICTMELRSLAPGEQATYTLRLPPGLEPGTYRYQTPIDGPESGESGQASAPPFAISG
ncbi:MAG TPA: hypothetical protein VNZ57_03490 [Longimicrobiales bacterium]|nr:hypothetical protein [Longimicrobiales bacterium]